MTLTQITEKGIKDGEIINADISSDASDRIAGSKITPAFGDQNLSTTGTAATGALSVTGTIASTGNIEITNNAPGITFTDSDDSHQFYIQSNGDALNLVDATNSTTKLGISNTGHITLTGNVSVNNGYLEVADTNVYINENITHAGDGDTRIRFPAADEISFEAGGNERLKVKSTGLTFVTVDDGSNARIDVSGTSSTVGRVVATTTGFAAFTNLQLRGSQIDFANASGVGGVFDSSNRLGIGTTSPDRLLHGAGATPILKLDATNNEAYLQLKTASPSNESYIGLVSGDIYMSTTGTGSSGNGERLRIKANGRVGINSSTPSGTLSVADPNGDNVTVVLATSASTNFIQFSDATNGHSYIGKENSQTSFYTANASGNATEKIAYFNAYGLNLVAGKGVNFSPYDNTGTDPYGSDSNSLDDYEKGSFQPSITATGTDPTQTFAHRYGYYVKIGKLVYVRVDVEFSNTGISGGSGEAVLSNLPFANSGETNAYGVTMSVGYSPNWGGGQCPTGGYINPTATFVYLMPYNTNGISFSSAAQIGNGTRLIAGFTYMTDS